MYVHPEITDRPTDITSFFFFSISFYTKYQVFKYFLRDSRRTADPPLQNCKSKGEGEREKKKTKKENMWKKKEKKGVYKVGHYHEIFVFSYSASTRRLGIGIDVQSRTTWVLKSKILLHSKEGSQARIWGPRTAWRASRDYTIIKRKEGKEKERGVTEQTRRELEGDPQIAPKCLHAYLLHPRDRKSVV